MKVLVPNYEQHNKLLESRKNKEVYLAINTKINCIDDWCPHGNRRISNRKIGIFLGKIMFIQDKQGKTILEYIPTRIDNNILEKEVDTLNPLWLDEINEGYKRAKLIEEFYGTYRKYYPQNVKTKCKRGLSTIVLNKEQIISYFKELHTLNTTFIQNYVNTLNTNGGIVAYPTYSVPYEAIGIIPPDKDFYDSVDWLYFRNYLMYDSLLSKFGYLNVIEFMDKNPHYRSIIPFFDELFYPYFIWSLKEYLLVYYQGVFAEKSNQLFNLASHIDDRDSIFSGKNKYAKLYDYTDNIINNILKSKELIDEVKFCCLDTRRLGISWGYCNDGFFHIEPLNYIPYIVPIEKKNGLAFRRIVILNNTLNNKIKPFYEPSPTGKYHYEPSPRGKYYFAFLEYYTKTFVEFYPRIYPSKANPPQGWSKEMMDKLDLKLE
ncbi:hypothetical protein DCO58_01640 [Helicobacter saguini]|uniref:Uncharacterized protein n=1 Tax=Helicobacter saguini TaxID=1548018 RepID=A0A099B5U1_9HELI|nr:hypothetical protein [Helicobacter saguini]MWV62915.1 hypothetical protein [Helicobacter saguini]MWV66415.1 hypothetical protein [Helicobacter saguini]MWV68766.1 hypothetical protein [Helicobacter saguini]MWV71680.1 hypothetical protein [Helicobacter saguini]TLD94481.1 hypothetical protein LS64_006025 [Helicobacter saguini]